MAAQHDFDLANAAGAAFRADLNLALVALASCSWGTAEPGTMFAHQWWADTTNALLKRRNTANSAWITIMPLASGVVPGTDVEAYSAARIQTCWIPAAAMTARTTNGAASGTVEATTNKNMFSTLDFDATTQEFAQFSINMPKSWDEGTITAVPVWSHAATTTNFGVVWSVAGVAVSDDDAMDVAFGTAQTSTDTGGTTNDCYLGPATSAITVGGSPAANDLVMFQVARVPSDGSDTMAIDARLHGVRLHYTINTLTDA